MVVFAIGQTYKEQARLAKRRLEPDRRPDARGRAQPGARCAAWAPSSTATATAATPPSYVEPRAVPRPSREPARTGQVRRSVRPTRRPAPGEVMRGWIDRAGRGRSPCSTSLVLVLGYRARSGVAARRSGSRARAHSDAPDRARPRPARRQTPRRRRRPGAARRQRRGRCCERRAAPARSGSTTRRSVWPSASDDGAALTPVDLPGLDEVLGLVVCADGRLRVSGLDDELPADDLRLHRLRPDLADASATTAGIWRLDPDTTASSVTGPAGATSQVDCVPRLRS